MSGANATQLSRYSAGLGKISTWSTPELQAKTQALRRILLT